MNLFSGYATFLELCLSEHSQSPFRHETQQVTVISTIPGIVEIIPKSMITPKPTAALILSAGIHGNETGPIELLDGLLSDIIYQHTAVHRPLLIIFGNLPAMQQQQRYLNVNLNRLFTENILTQPQLPASEQARAAEIMLATKQFAQRFHDFWHYDLHTAIRDSAIEKFALYPFVKDRKIPKAQIVLLAAAGIEAILIQNKPSATFSGFSSALLGGESFTVELGKVRPFGQNVPNDLQKLKQTVLTLLSSDAAVNADAGAGAGELPQGHFTEASAAVKLFSVCHEIINSGDTFRLHVPEDIANFSAFKEGDVIWSDAQESYRIEGEAQYIVFPNSQVGIGQRAGLMIKPVSVSMEDYS